MVIDKNEISEKLKSLKALTPPKSASVPVSGILFENGKLMTNNFEMAATAEIISGTDESFVIPGDAIDYINSLPSGSINIYYDEKKVIVEGKKSKAAFQTIKVADYPIPDNLKREESSIVSCTFDRDELFNAINSVIYACDSRSLKEAQKGLLFCADGSELSIVAADMHRIAKNTIPCDKEFKIIIPKESLLKASSLLESGNISFVVNKTTITISNDIYKLTLRAIAGEFLKYESIFPQEYEAKFTIDRKEAIQTFNRAMLCTGGEKIFVRLTGDSDSLIVQLANAKNDFTEDISISGEKTEDIVVGMNPRLLVECFKSVNDESMEIRYISSLKPVVITAGTMSAIILPVRLNQFER